MVVLSLMSGTSADGVDAVAARLRLQPDGLEWEVLARSGTPFSFELRDVLLAAMRPESSNVLQLTQLNRLVGDFYAQVARPMVEELRSAYPVDLIALSGQTVYHIPRRDRTRGWETISTLQIGEPAAVAHGTGVPVMSDFRQGDMAAGGQGAPLVSFGDALLYGVPGKAIAIHNLGGISNLTYLDLRTAPQVLAFDTGPANCLIDEAAALRLGLPFDEDGKAAARGTVDEELLTRWLQHPYFRLEPPKTTGRELFTLPEFLGDRAARLDTDDLLATLTAFTAHSVAQAYADFVLPRGLDEIRVAGGGARNPTLIAHLRELLPVPVRTFSELGWEPSDREALAFAVMAYAGYHGMPNVIPTATGARPGTIVGRLTNPVARHSSPFD